MNRFVPCLLLVLLLLALLSDRSAAGQGAERARFSVHFAGIKVGELTLQGITAGNRYSLAGRLQSTGLLRAVANLRYDVLSQGMIRDGRFLPARYRENANTGDRTSDIVMSYRNGVPQVDHHLPARTPEPWDVDPATQGGTVDPGTAGFLALRSVPRSQVCQVDIDLFDGRQRTAIRYSDPRASGNKVICDGVYSRIAGYSGHDLNEQRHFPFTVTYASAPDGRMQVRAVRIGTVYGPARLVRR